jgi:hypothetical protein
VRKCWALTPPSPPLTISRTNRFYAHSPQQRWGEGEGTSLNETVARVFRFTGTLGADPPAHTSRRRQSSSTGLHHPRTLRIRRHGGLWLPLQPWPSKRRLPRSRSRWDTGQRPLWSIPHMCRSTGQLRPLLGSQRHRICRRWWTRSKPAHKTPLSCLHADPEEFALRSSGMPISGPCCP